MKGAAIHGARDVRFEDVPAPKIEKPTDAVASSAPSRVSPAAAPHAIAAI